jgi:hypothetical protein
MIFLQLMTALFAITLAWLQKVPVRKMIDHGASIQEENQFHKASGYIKVLWAFTFAFMYAYSTLIGGFLLFIGLGLIIWMVFDPALNLFTGEKAFYVGNTAKTDKQLRKLGKYAGQIKAGVCLLCVITLNVLYFLW